MHTIHKCIVNDVNLIYFIVLEKSGTDTGTLSTIGSYMAERGTNDNSAREIDTGKSLKDFQ